MKAGFGPMRTIDRNRGTQVLRFDIDNKKTTRKRKELI